jgi:predicted CDP-diglyceride synthetase/phosphatidate cytidylyltransferase
MQICITSMQQNKLSQGCTWSTLIIGIEKHDVQKYICTFLSRKVLPHMSTRAKKDWLTPGAIVTLKIAKLAVDPLTEIN